MGSGSVYQITDEAGRIRWIAQLSMGGRTNRRYVKRVRETERAARAALKVLRDEAEAKRGSSRMTLSVYLDQWAADARNLRPRTRVEYQNAIRYHINPTIGHVRLGDLTPIHVESMLRTLEPTMAPKSLRNVLGVLRRGLTFAVRADLVTRNVASRDFIDPVRVPYVEPRVLTVDELRRILTASRGHWLEALILTAAGTGMRQGELLALSWADVDLERAQLDVRATLRRVVGLTRRRGRYVRDEPKTARSERSVPLAPAVVEAIASQRQRLIAAGFVPTATGPVFPSQRGKPLSAGWVTHQFYLVCEAAGVRRAPFKALRATFSTQLFEAGIPERRIQDLLGHKPDSRVTHAHYIGTGAEWDLAMAAVDELVG